MTKLIRVGCLMLAIGGCQPQGDPVPNAEELGLPPRPSREIRPVYSPDGRYLAFNSNRSGLYDIYILEMATGEIRQVTQHRGNNYVPRWSPDGTQLVYYRFTGNPWSGDVHHNVHVLSLASLQDTAIVADPSNDMFGDWLPDGRSLVFASDRDGPVTLYTVDVPTQRVTPLVDDRQGITMFQPFVHRATGDIVFEGRINENSDVWLYEASTGAISQLTHTPEDEYGPSLSPDGSTILFQVADSTGLAQIGLIDRSGGGYRVITKDGSYVTPIWGPDGTIVTVYNDPVSNDPVLGNQNLYTLRPDGTGLKLLLDW